MGDLVDAFEVAIAANEQLVPELDDALVATGRKIAARVDEATETGEGQEVTKALYLVPHLMNVLREMHATPESRRMAGVVVEQRKSGKLAQLRAVTSKQVG